MLALDIQKPIKAAKVLRSYSECTYSEHILERQVLVKMFWRELELNPERLGLTQSLLSIRPPLQNQLLHWDQFQAQSSSSQPFSYIINLF